MGIASTQQVGLYISNREDPIAIGDVVIDSLVPSSGPGTITIVFKGVAQEIVREVALGEQLAGVSLIYIPAVEAPCSTG